MMARIEKIIFLISLLLPLATNGQDVFHLNGRVILLNSDKTPVAGISVNGFTLGEDGVHANTFYTTDRGEFQLIFPTATPGQPVQLILGEKDKYSTQIEAVSIEQLTFSLPADESKVFEISTCKKGQRDSATLAYYRNLQPVIDSLFIAFESRLKRLENEKVKDYAEIARQRQLIDYLRSNRDSLALYAEALEFASINRDNASKRTLKYLNLLDSGVNVIKAREALDIDLAMAQMRESKSTFDDGLNELDLRADASIIAMDFDDAMACYDSIIEMCDFMKMDKRIVATFNQKKAWTLSLLGRYHDASLLLEDALKTELRSEFPNQLKLSELYYEMGNTIQRLGLYDSALRYHKKCLTLRKKLFPQNSPELAQIYSGIGNTFRYYGEADSALFYHQQDVQIVENNTDSLSLERAASYQNLALTLFAKGEYDSALQYHLMDIEIRENLLPKNSPELAIAYNNIVGTLHANMQYEEALEYLHKDIEITLAVLGNTHPDLGSSYSNLGITLNYLDRNKEAVEYLLKAIDIQKSALGVDHPELASTYSNIGIVYRDIEEYDTALFYLTSSLEISLKTMDEDHPDIGVLYNNIAVTLQGLERYSEAIEYHLMDIRNSTLNFGDTHPNLGIAHVNLARTLELSRDFEGASQNQQIALQIVQTELGSDHPIAKHIERAGYKITLAKAISQAENYQFTACSLTLASIEDSLETYAISYYQGICELYLGTCGKAIGYFKSSKRFDDYETTDVLLFNLSIANAMCGNLDEARALLSDSILSSSDSNVQILKSKAKAIFHCQSGEQKEAFVELEAAVEYGYDDLEWFKINPFLNAIASTPRYKKLLRRVRKNQRS